MKGILVMAYGSPNKIEDIAPFYTDIRRGSPPPPELLHELTERYKAIGGTSPLLDITMKQAKIMEDAMGGEYKAYVGMRHWEPWIHEAVAQMKADGIHEAIAIVMAPHFSRMSIAQYIKKVEDANEEYHAGIHFDYVQSWHAQPAYIRALENRVKAAMSKFSEQEKQDLAVIFTAHSLPERILQDNDPYKEQLLETSRLVSEKLGIKNWRFAFQSAGRTQEKWLGPDLLEVLGEIAAEGYKAVLVCSVGFVTDHLEVMYDIDIEGQARAKKLGIHLERAASLNDEPLLGQMFVDLVKQIGESK